MTGEEILELGTIEMVNDKLIVPDKKYIMAMPVQLYWNHERRLRKVWTKEGYPGVIKYVALVESIFKSQNN